MVLVAPLPIQADSEILQATPLSILSSRQRDAYAKDGTYSTYGTFFDQSRSFAISNVRSSPYPPFIDGKLDQSIWDWSLCSSSTDETCAINSDNYVTAESVLGICLNAEEIGCIDEVNIKIKNGESENLHLVAYTGAETVFTENTTLSIPRGSTSTVWESQSGQRFLVTALVSRTFFHDTSKALRNTTEFLMQIERISTTQILNPASVHLMENPYYPGKHMFSGIPVEYKPLMFDSPTAFTVKVRLPDVVNGWFQARFANGTILSSQLSADRTLYQITGTVASVVVAGGLASAAELPADFFQKVHGDNKFYPGAILGPIPPGQSEWSLDVYKAWAPYIGDQALTTMYEWNVVSTGTQGFHPCLQSLKGVVGLVATNAAVYSGSPPSWDDATSSLLYKVASPHYDENNDVISGSYTISMLSSAARCLYGVVTLPATAEVTVWYDGVSTYETTRAVTENQGWLNFSVTGFHYSTPTIALKLGKKLVEAPPNVDYFSQPSTLPIPPLVMKGKRLSANRIAAYAHLPIAVKSKLTLKLAASSQKFCKIVRTQVVGLRMGKWCKVTVTMTPPRGKSKSRTVMALILN